MKWLDDLKRRAATPGVLTPLGIVGLSCLIVLIGAFVFAVIFVAIAGLVR